jgi:hypothetical protein
MSFDNLALEAIKRSFLWSMPGILVYSYVIMRALSLEALYSGYSWA